MSRLTKSAISNFQNTLFSYYETHGRHELPWRHPAVAGSFDAYAILVSEVMLQQTQVARVIPKYVAFMTRFPNLSRLAAAPLAEVLRTWSGLGYNRRAKFLWQAAQKTKQEYNNVIPHELATLQTLPGIGPNTAGAVMVYTFNQPAIFIETNIRTVFIHHFFEGQQNVADKEIAKLLEQTLDQGNPRDFYWALMDYGSFLKKSVGNLSQASEEYTKQSPFSGSRRQIRGQVIRALLGRPLTYQQLARRVLDSRLEQVLTDLQAETLIEYVENRFRLLAR